MSKKIINLLACMSVDLEFPLHESVALNEARKGSNKVSINMSLYLLLSQIPRKKISSLSFSSSLEMSDLKSNLFWYYVVLWFIFLPLWSDKGSTLPKYSCSFSGQVRLTTGRQIRPLTCLLCLSKNKRLSGHLIWFVGLSDAYAN